MIGIFMKFYIPLPDGFEFKKINDQYGHYQGDLVLRHVADILKQNLRANQSELPTSRLS